MMQKFNSLADAIALAEFAHRNLTEKGWDEAFRYGDSDVDLRFYRSNAKFVDMKELT